MNARLLPRLALAIAALSLCSCAAVKVTDTTPAGAATTKAPRKVYVAPFSLAGANIKEHPMRKHPGKLGAEAQQLLADFLVAEISKSVAPATRVSSPTAAGRDGWLVTGEITRINEGSRFLRMAIGLGAGGTKLETNVSVQSLPSRKAFLQFRTSGGSGSMPGAATNPIPFSSAPSAALQARLGVSDDAARTARMITDRLATQLGKKAAR
ncbi:MAG: DUF4410 domain-containing protein [Chthoniobacteraceae bacterium]